MSKNFLLKLLLIFMVFSHVFAATDSNSPQVPLVHGKHLEANMEWWNFFGHLLDANNHLFGFSLTFLRLNVPLQKPPSQWTTQDIYTSYFTITDSESEQFYYQEKVNRTSFNYAGASDNELLIWNRNWQAVMNAKNIMLQAQTDKVALTLQLIQIKPPFLFEGINFLKNNDLYDYLMPRINGVGELRIGEKYYHIVNVQAGMEHGFQKNKDSDIMWDRFLIQLNNGDDIFLYILTSKNSTLVYPESFGIINHSDGTSIRLKLADFYLEQSESWYSQNSKIIYPSSWTLTIPEYHYRLNIIPTMKNQEVDTINTNYWGGQNLVAGEKDGVQLTGYAYIELSKQTVRNYIL